VSSGGSKHVAFVKMPLVHVSGARLDVEMVGHLCQCYKKISSLHVTRPNKLECLFLAITFQSCLTFAGNTRSLPEKKASERCSNWVGSCLALKF